MLDLQRDVKKKTVTYGIAAVLLAVLVTAISYNFGVLPSISPVFSELKTFSSYEELENFLKVSMEQAKQFENLPRSPFLEGGEIGLTMLDAKAAYASAPEHSTTNIQVAGVDEADIVKTDGEYLYVVSGPDIYILKAYPPNQTALLSKIELNETYGAQIYVNEDKLAVLGNNYPFLAYYHTEEDLRFLPYVYIGEAFVKVYDLTNRSNPVLTRTVTLNGTLSGSRMIGNYVYAVVNQPAIGPNGNETDLGVMLPKISINDSVKEVQATEIRYVDTTDVFYYFTTVVAVNVINDAQEPTYEPFLTGQTALMYVSLSNMYLVVPNTNVWILRDNAGGAREETLIYRVKLDEEKIVVEAEGAVFGYVLNQFSMDEYNDFFRIATTKWTNEGSINNLFILNMSLNVVGKLENLAPGESIYSARFMGNRCYLVTFRKIDPLFVIDLRIPSNPKVLGWLKITGYSDYLHPYDESHIIGIGKETVAAEQGDFAWYQGVKISLFDVSNVSNPVEIDKYEIGDRGTDSPVLRDHKAFLFDRSKHLLVLPVLVAEIDEAKHPEGVPPYAYGDYVWQGAYVFDISIDGGLVLRGRITHLENDMDLMESGYYVKRPLYIDNVLYTISDKKIKMNNLENLAEINEVELP